jgi:hypothetical protein
MVTSPEWHFNGPAQADSLAIRTLAFRGARG